MAEKIKAILSIVFLFILAYYIPGLIIAYHDEPNADTFCATFIACAIFTFGLSYWIEKLDKGDDDGRNGAP